MNKDTFHITGLIDLMVFDLSVYDVMSGNEMESDLILS